MEWHLATIWESVSDAIPERPAVLFGGTALTWRDYEDRASRLAAVLNDHGVGPNGKVALYLYNGPEYLEGQFAACKVRATPVNVNYRYMPAELAYILDNSDSEVIIFDERFGSRLEEALALCTQPPRLLVQVGEGPLAVHGALRYEEILGTAHPRERELRAADDVFMMYTGGTTGMPKGVMYSHETQCRKLIEMMSTLLGVPAPTAPNAIAQLARDLDSNDALPTWLPGCPLMHAAGLLLGALGPHIVGGTAVLLPSTSFDPDELWQIAAETRAGGLAIVGDAFGRPMLTALEMAASQNTPYDLSQVRYVFSGGTAMSPDVKAGLLEHLPPEAVLFDILGSTEGGMGSSISTRSSVTSKTRFSLTPTVKVLRPDGAEVTPGSGEEGIVAIPDFVPLGYYKDAERTASTFPTIGGVRYTLPGDYARVEADGTITFLGRGSTVVNTAGEKVFVEEVEELLKGHPAVTDCLVSGQPDELLGNRLVAVVSAAESIGAADLIAWMKTQISGYKVPREITFVDVVPRTPTGKPDYAAAAELLGDLAKT